TKTAIWSAPRSRFSSTPSVSVSVPSTLPEPTPSTDTGKRTRRRWVTSTTPGAAIMAALITAARTGSASLRPSTTARSRAGRRAQDRDEVRRRRVPVGREQPLQEVELTEDRLRQVQPAGPVPHRDLPHAGYQRRRRGDRVRGPHRPGGGQQQRAVAVVVELL